MLITYLVKNKSIYQQNLNNKNKGSTQVKYKAKKRPPYVIWQSTPKRQICRFGSQPSNDKNVALALNGLKRHKSTGVFVVYIDTAVPVLGVTMLAHAQRP
jgi:hypothetical protein